VTAGIITDHIHKLMYTKYDYPTWRQYHAKATVKNQDSRSVVPHIRSGYELRLHEVSKDPGLASFWIFESGIYDKPRCEDLAKEIRKHFTKSQLHQDFEKVEISVDVGFRFASPHVTIWINAINPKPSFKFKHNLTKLTDLSSMSDHDSVGLGATGMLLNAIRERDEKIAAEETRKRAEEEAELARQKALEEQVRLENEKNLQEWEHVKKFVDEIGDFEVKVPSEEGDGNFTYMPIRQVIDFENDLTVNFGYHMNLNMNRHNRDEAKKIIIDWAVSYGAREPQSV
jgi:hypothetical protein